MDEYTRPGESLTRTLIRYLPRRLKGQYGLLFPKTVYREQTSDDIITIIKAIEEYNDTTVSMCVCIASDNIIALDLTMWRCETDDGEKFVLIL